MATSNQEQYRNDLLETQSPDFSVDEVKNLAAKLYGFTGGITLLDSERDQNFLIDTAPDGQYVLKIANSAENPAIIDMQLKALDHIALVDPGLPIPKVMHSQNGLAIEQIQAQKGTKHFVRLLTFLKGDPPENNPTNQALLRPMGTCLARLGLALRGFYYPITDYDLLWDLKHTAKLRQYLPYIKDAEHHELISYFLDRFDQNVHPLIPKLRAQFIHNDLTPDNILVDKNKPGQIVGLIDFGDFLHSSLINDLGTTIASMIFGRTNLLEAAAEVVAGYNEINQLEGVELRLLFDLIAARLTMMNVIATWRVTLHPNNQEYITGSVEQTWHTLEAWRELDPTAATKKFFRVCGLWEDEVVKPAPKKKKETLQTHLTRRAHLLGPCAFLFYERPLHIIRGEDVWLYDIDGRRYLDAYNNVAHVGHCHPHVVNAIAKQARLLNTSTRYMHGLILELAKRITYRMPEPLSVCMFVCTGSEANELAWQMSKLVSGNRGALITRYSYHGSSDAAVQFSTEIVPQENLPPHVQTIFPPTSDTEFQMPDSGAETAISTLGERGYQPAMLIVDTAFVTDGVFTSPNDYLKNLFVSTRAAGGLCVADEVQGGFGRLGHHFWGFQFDDVVPDIVTLGKPMGNGHPIAAVVTRPEIAEALANHTGYFNTFGGNPVSCAAGLAVLDVIEKEDLQRNALEVGQYLRDGLVEIQKDNPVIGGLHGSGLLLGMDIVTSDGKSDPEKADRIMNRMRENGVLLGTTGQHYSILKIRPPIVFLREHAEIMLEVLKKVLKDL